MYIRKATIHDVKILSEVENLCFPITEAASEQTIAKRLEYYSQHFWLLFDKDTLVGFVDGMCTNEKDLSDEMYEDATMHKESGDWQMVFGLNTIPSYRRRGCGALLLNEIIEDARYNKRKGVVLTCKEHLIHYYRKFGFVNEGISKSTHGDVKWYQMRLTFPKYNITLESARLLLRPWEMHDAPKLYEMAKDPDIGIRCGWRTHTSLEHSRFILRHVLMVEHTFAIVLKESNEVIGNIAFSPMRASNFARNENEGEVGFWLGKQYWNHGYMSEALKAILDYSFKNLNINLVWAGYFENNFASKSVQEKCGFKFHHVIEDLYVPSINLKTNLYVSCLDKETWERGNSHE